MAPFLNQPTINSDRVNFMFRVLPSIRLRRAPAHILAAILLIGALFAGRPAAAANLEGVWQLATPQLSLVPADGKAIPFIAAGREAYDENRKAAAAGDFSFDATETGCSSPGLPRMMLTPMPMKIFQDSRMVSVLFQWNHLMRQIELVRPATQDLDVPTMMGRSFGHWDGDTLVVESNNFLPQKLLDDLIPSSEDLVLTEYLRLRDHDTLEDRIQIVDPQMFTRKWETVILYKRASDDLFPFREDVCLDRLKAGQLPLSR